MRCQDLYDFLGEDLESEISAPRTAELQEHVQRCEDCRMVVESCRRTVRFYRGEPAPIVPAGLHRRLMKRVGSQGHLRA